MLTPREKSPLPEKFSSEEDRINDAASSRTASPGHYQRAIPAPRRFLRIAVVPVVGRTLSFELLPADLGELATRC